MSITGNGSLSIRKKSVRDSKAIATGFRNLKFAHKATAGDTGIDLTALVTPSELGGFVNPNSSTLLEANLRRNRDNLRIVSSLRGELLDYTSYGVSSTRITFKGFTAEEGEIFVGYVDSASTTGIQVIAGEPIVSTGELAVGATDYNVGELFRVNANPNKQLGEVEVYRNGAQQFRCIGNDLSNEGNYIEINNGSGLGQIIRFKEAPSGQSDSIAVVSVSNLAVKPNESQLAQIETVSGQVDRLIDVVSEELEIDSTEFQTAPNQPDLKQFGDRVLGLEEPGQPGVPLQATITIAGAQKLKKTQTKILSSSVSTETTINELSFNNLIIGMKYTVKAQLRISMGADSTVNFVYTNGGVQAVVQQENEETSAEAMREFMIFDFTATEPTLTLSTSSLVGNYSLVGDGGRGSTYATLTERPDLVETTDYT